MDSPAASGSPLIGRHRELELIAECLKSARSSGASVVFLRGEPGVGKSRLAVEAVQRARLLGFRVLSGRADELDRGIGYAALREALMRALLDEADPGLRDIVDAVNRALFPPPGGSGPPPPVPAGSLQTAYGAAERLLRAWSEREPVLLALDDLHAADGDTLAVTSLLARELADARVVIVATLRAHPPDLGIELAALVERLASYPHVQVLDIEPLDDEDVRALAASRLGAPPDDELAATLVEMTRGNPFYVEELLRAYQDAGVVDIDGSRSRLRAGAPPVALSTRNALLTRVSRLGASARAVGRVMTAFQRFDLDKLDVITELTGLDAPEVELAFDVLVQARILAPSGPRGYEFTHPIVRATLDDDLGPAERRRLHATAATRLLADREAGRAVSVLELATHVAASATVGDPVAVAILAEAGDTVATTAPRSAADWYERALEILPEGRPGAGSLLARRARALYLGMQKRAAADVARAAVAALPPGVERSRTATILVAALSSLGLVSSALEAADEFLGGEGDAPRLLAQRAQLLVYLDRFEEADATARRGLDAVADPTMEAFALAPLAASAYGRGRTDEAVELLDRALSHAEELTPGVRLMSATTRASYLAYAGFRAKAEEALAQANALSARLGGVAFRTDLEPVAVWIDGLAGRWDEALTRADAVVHDLERTAELFQVPLVRVMQSWILLERGQIGAAAAAHDAIPEGTPWGSMVAWSAAGIEAAKGHDEVARKLLIEAWDHDRATGRRSVAAPLLGLLIEVELSDGRREAAAEWLAELEHAVATVTSPWVRCIVGRSRARVLGDVDAARHAGEQATEDGLRFEAAVALLTVAQLDRAATEELRRAHDQFRDLGAEPWRRRAASLLRDRGLKVPRRRSRPADELTTPERELARLVADGLTNREIANVLYLSPKTVEVYLSRLYAKVGCKSRVELATAVTTGDLEAILVAPARRG